MPSKYNAMKSFKASVYGIMLANFSSCGASINQVKQGGFHRVGVEWKCLFSVILCCLRMLRGCSSVAYFAGNIVPINNLLLDKHVQALLVLCQGMTSHSDGEK